jgi:hypothetical protein
MGIAGSPNIFQEIMMELMINLELVRNYLDNLLIIIKLNLSDHRDKLKGIHKVARGRLKVNAYESKFCAHEMGYLEYILTRDRIQ